MDELFSFCTSPLLSFLFFEVSAANRALTCAPLEPGGPVQFADSCSVTVCTVHKLYAALKHLKTESYSNKMFPEFTMIGIICYKPRK